MSSSALNIPALSQACTEARGLSMDAVHKANSGHLGLPLGVTELGTVLYMMKDALCLSLIKTLLL